MTNDCLVSFRLPARAVAAIMVEAEKSGRSRSAVVRDAITFALPDPLKYNSDAATADLERRLRAVTKTIFDPKRVANAEA